MTEVANESSNGLVRVELSVDTASPSLIPLEHGLSGTAEVEVGQLSPAALVLRAAGKLLSPVPQRRPLAGESAGVDTTHD